MYLLLVARMVFSMYFLCSLSSFSRLAMISCSCLSISSSSRIVVGFKTFWCQTGASFFSLGVSGGGGGFSVGGAFITTAVGKKSSPLKIWENAN